jgi:hypothetical protein
VIDLMHGTAPIYKRPHKMVTQQLGELKEHITEFLEKGYICHTPVLKSTEPKPPYVCLGCLITRIATI